MPDLALALEALMGRGCRLNQSPERQRRGTECGGARTGKVVRMRTAGAGRQADVLYPALAEL